MELARLVGGPEEVHIPSLEWKAVCVKVSCHNPNQIGGTSEVQKSSSQKGQKDYLVLL